MSQYMTRKAQCCCHSVAGSATETAGLAVYLTAVVGEVFCGGDGAGRAPHSAGVVQIQAGPSMFEPMLSGLRDRATSAAKYIKSALHITTPRSTGYWLLS